MQFAGDLRRRECFRVNDLVVYGENGRGLSLVPLRAREDAL